MTDLKFEDCLARLEQIVGRLETGNLPLEESLKIFEEGIGLARSCARYLEDAEKRIEVLAMDDDDYRRGRLTNHKVFGEAIAILAGDALLTYAFLLVAQNAALARVDAKVVCDVVAEIAAAAGTLGMVGGQVVDIESEGKAVTPEALEYIHIHKTAALLRASLSVGARLRGADAAALAAVGEAGQSLGIAFQIVEDLLDVEGSLETLGKTAGSDERKQKVT